MRPAHPKMDGALYRPNTTVACGTTTAADDSLGYEGDKVVKGWGFQKSSWSLGAGADSRSRSLNEIPAPAVCPCSC